MKERERRDIRNEHRAWPAWQAVDCDDYEWRGQRLLGCGTLAGEQCVLTEEDMASGMWDKKHHIIGGYRRRVHLARWQAYLAAIGPDGRRELAVAQEAKSQRLRRWPHI